MPALPDTLDAVLDAISDMVCLLARDGTVLRCNRSMMDVLGRERDDVVGRKCYELMHGGDTFFERCPYIEMLRTGKRESFELPLGDRWYQVTADPLLEDGGEIIGAVHIVRDVTGRKSAEDALRASERTIRRLNDDLERRVEARTRELSAANKDLQEFMYSVSHDLRTPLRAVDGFSLAVLDTYGEVLGVQGREDLGRVRAAAQRLGQLIDALLSLARVGHSAPRPEETDISAIAMRVIAELREREPERTVEVAIDDGLVVKTDPLLAEVVLANLLGNAWKFSSRRDVAHIAVGTMDRDGRRAFYVRDDGIGFDPAYAHKLFTPFESLHSPLEFAGTGVGLATVARTLECLGGTCWAEGRPGEGATFFFILPDADGEE